MTHTVDTINTRTGKNWDFIFNKEAIFNNVSLKTNYINDRKPVELRDDGRVLTEDDRAVYEKYFKAAIADMNIILAKYYHREFDDYEVDDKNVYINLSLPSTAKDSVSFSMREYIASFFELHVLKKWFGTEADMLGISAELLEVEQKLKSASNYRSSVVRRPINPVF